MEYTDSKRESQKSVNIRARADMNSARAADEPSSQAPDNYNSGRDTEGFLALCGKEKKAKDNKAKGIRQQVKKAAMEKWG